MPTVNEQRLIDEFLELVQIDSETKYEEEIARVLKKKFTELGLDVTEDNSMEETGHGAGNLICTLKGTKPDADTIYFTSHMDTVVPGKNVNPSIKDGYIVSDGTTILGADDKAGLAAMLEAVRTIQENQIEHGDIQFVITVGEESGLVGAKSLDGSLLKANYGYALDSNGDVGGHYCSSPNASEGIYHHQGKNRSCRIGSGKRSIRDYHRSQSYFQNAAWPD